MQKLQKNKLVIGLDESGRGALAGPVIACAVMIEQVSNLKFQVSNKAKISISKIRKAKIKDSKKTTAKKREEIFNLLKNCPEIKWAIGKVSEKIIDKINILQASKLAMKKAIKEISNLPARLAPACLQVAEGKSGRSQGEADGQSPRPSCSRLPSSCRGQVGQIARRSGRAIFNEDVFLIIDGNFKIDLPCHQKPIIKGDEKRFLIKLASIIAKVSRDKIMLNYHKKYPEYGFNKHKGYGTKLHLETLKRYGPCPIHRTTFKFKKQ